MNTEPIDTLAQTFLFGLVFCSLLTDVYVFFQSSTNDKQMKKRIDYYSDVYKAVTSVGLNQYEVDSDGTIKIENELKETITSKVNEVKETLEKLEKEKKEIEESLSPPFEESTTFDLHQQQQQKLPKQEKISNVQNEKLIIELKETENKKKTELKEKEEDLTWIHEEKKKKKEKREKEKEKEEKIQHSSKKEKEERRTKRK